MFEPAIVLEAVMSHPTIILAMIFGLVLLLSFLLAEKPHVRPDNEAHGITPRVNGKSASGGDLSSLPRGAWEREKAGEILPPPVIAPVELPAPMKEAEALLMPLVAQFSEMQQHMFEQFQQTLLMMAQMFGNLQREQMALIRQELEQIHELTRQLHALQAEGAGRAAMPLPATPQAVAPSSHLPGRSSKPADSAARAGTSSPKVCDPNVHVWLSQRLSALQQERQNRWQKVLSLVTGK